MTYDYIILSLFIIAFFGSILLLRVKVKKEGWAKIDTYSIFIIPLFLWLSISRTADIYGWEIPAFVDSLFFVVFLVMGIVSGIQLVKSLKANQAFKVYRSNLFIVFFCVVAVITLFPF